jgi:hypothetical protein
MNPPVWEQSPIEARLPDGILRFRKIPGSAVNYEQNAGDQRADSRDDIKYFAKTYTKKAQAGDD